MDSKAQLPVLADEISLNDLLRVIWQFKFWILVATLVGGALAYVAAHVATRQYEAKIIVSPVANSPGANSMGGVSPLAAQFGGLASLAGLSVPTDSHKAETVAVLQSEALTERYIDVNRLLPVISPPSRGSWLKAPQTPTLWKASQRFDKNIRKVTMDLKTGLVTMTIRWTEPHTAAVWANGLVKMTNDYLRQQAIAESERNIGYLSQEATRTDIVGVKQATYSLLESEISKEMLARGSDEYALKVVDPAIAPERASSPQPALWTLLGLAGGFTAALLTVLALPR